MYYLESGSVDPTFNLALEQYLFDSLARDGEFFMLWQNRDAVIVGLHQNTVEEVNRAYLERNNIPVVRRLSGGGAVFHDLGNLNFTFITKAPHADKLDFGFSCLPILEALEDMGVHAEISGRNDLTIDGKKFSGNSRYMRGGLLMHHGTILFDTDLDKMSEALRVSEDKIVSKSVKSVRARVTNVREHMSRDYTVCDFWARIREYIAGRQSMPSYILSEQDRAAVSAIQRERYATYAWNYGRSPNFSIKKQRRIPDFGAIRISMEIENGLIADFATDGDYFGNRTYHDVAALLHNKRLEKNDLQEALSGISLEEYYKGLHMEEFIRLILG